MLRRTFLRAAALSGGTCLLAACGISAPAADPAALRITCTMFPAYDLLRSLCGARAALTLLVAPGMEAHGFVPSAQDMAAAAAADLLVLTGGDADAWAKAMMDGAGTGPAASLRLTELWPGGGEAPDEHLWTSPARCLVLLQALADALKRADPDGAALYDANLAAAQEPFAALDADFAAFGAQVRKPTVLADRQPFGCLAADYGIPFAAAFDGCTTDTEVSAERMAVLADLAAAQGVGTVFCLELSDGGLCRALADAAGAGTGRLYSGQAISRADFDAGLTLADMLSYNLDALRAAQEKTEANA